MDNYIIKYGYLSFFLLEEQAKTSPTKTILVGEMELIMHSVRDYIMKATTNDMTAVQNNKDNQRETMILDIALWMLIYGVVYVFSKLIS